MPCLPLIAALTLIPLQDTIVVTADNPPVWGDSLVLVEEVRIGSLLGEEEYTFGHVRGVAVTADGTIWVGDSQA